jgi:hypothetical protein
VHKTEANDHAFHPVRRQNAGNKHDKDMPPTSDQTSRSDPPLWSIAAAVIIILVAPLALYSLAPTGPIREGDTVFSEGEQHVQIRPSTTDQRGKADTCLLDPNSPLIVLQTLTDHADDSIIAHVQGNPSGEWPFCPVHTEVLLKIHQVFQKPAVFGTVREILVGLFGR